MNTEILIRGCTKDLPWMEYAIRSMGRFCTGFSGVTILVASDEASRFLKFEGMTTHDGKPVRIQAYPPHKDKPMLACMGELCFADEYCPDADLVLHTDSDCVFKCPVTPDNYISDGKPDLLIRTYAWLKQAGLPMYCWKAPTDAALGMNVRYETMARHPAVHWTGLYPAMRERIEKVHNKLFMHYVLGFPERFPWGFAEFPALGAWAMEWAPEAYHLVDVTGVSEEEIGIKWKNTIHQGWTHFNMGNSEDVRKAIEQKQLFDRLIS